MQDLRMISIQPIALVCTQQLDINQFLVDRTLIYRVSGSI